MQYELILEEGPPHDLRFTMAAVVDGVRMGVGCGKTKKAATQEAAGNILHMLVADGK